MCGILGFVAPTRSDGIVERLSIALEALRTRGPDDCGLAFQERNSENLTTHYADLHAGGYRISVPPKVAQASTLIAHTRFSIVELSRLGAQPMVSPDGAVTLVFNGEIYNHNALRTELAGKGHVFRSHSDTEVLLRAYLEWGEACFQRFVGWWAIALHDRRRDGVLLARDRLGKAPLYLRSVRGGLYWASEANALLELTADSPSSPNLPAIADFVSFGLRDAWGRTLFGDINSLPAASYAWVRDGVLQDPKLYWALPTRRMSESDIGIDEAVAAVRESIIDATNLRLQADVPVAVQLSGGLDSSIILACAAAGGRPVRAVTASFDSPDANEDQFACAAAAAFPGIVEHQLIHPESDVDYGSTPAFLDSMGEPVHSPNQAASRELWKALQAEGYKAVLYGAGGDEVFAGYYGDFFAPHVRGQIASGQFGGAFSNLWNLSERSRTPVDMVRRLAVTMPGGTEIFRLIQKGIPSHQRIFKPLVLGEGLRTPAALNEKMLALMGDMRMNYWLRVDNQNSMQVPIELRSPFLDHRVVDLAYTLPTSYLIRDGWMKWILRKAFEAELPESVVWRKVKMGFPFPLKRWLLSNIEDVRRMLMETDAPGVDKARLVDALEYNIQRDANFVWRVLAYATWWKQQDWQDVRAAA